MDNELTRRIDNAYFAMDVCKTLVVSVLIIGLQ